ncbi:MAG: biotin--[acetyl-CoA-carboxylase] ligase [Salinirussus sp.]
MQETRARVLDAIANGPISGSAIASDLDVTRAAVWKHVEALRDEGFAIEAGPDGYELTGIPDFGGPAVEFGLEAPYAIEFHDAIPSTNDRGRTLAEQGAANIVVLADEQTAGRGRLDRGWASPSGGVWLSIVLRPDGPPRTASLYTLAGAVATASAAREAGVNARIKWPNDVLVADEKIAGILTEMAAEADRLSWIVVGIGVNANVDPVDLSDFEATSLAAELGESVDRRRFTQRLLETFHALCADLDDIVPAWRELETTLGRNVRVETPAGPVEGKAVDVDDTGALIVQTENERHTVTAGDCEHLRTS